MTTSTPANSLFTASSAQEVRRQIGKGAQVNEYRDKGRWRPLHWAAERGNLEVLNALITGGAKPNLKNRDGDTALHIGYNKPSIVKALLRAGANPMIKNRNGHTALEWLELANPGAHESLALLEQAQAQRLARKQRRDLVGLVKKTPRPGGRGARDL